MAKSNILYILFFLLGALCCQSETAATNDKTTDQAKTSEQASPVAHLDVAEFISLYQKSDNAVLLDVRSPDETAQGVIEGANEMDYYSDTFEEQLKTLDPQKSYFIYCRSGSRSAKTATILSKMGFRHLYNLEGGFEAYSESISRSEGK